MAKPILKRSLLKKQEEAAMKSKFLVAVVVALVGSIAIASVAILNPNLRNSTAIATPEKLTGIGATAQQQAAKENKFLFLLVYDKDDVMTKTLKKNLEKTAPKLGARWAAIDKNSLDGRSFIRKSRLTSAPTPYVLTIAPNGAITGSTQEVAEVTLRGSMVSPGFQACLKPLQDGKLVLLCIQNNSTKQNEAAMRGIDEFKNDSKYTYFVEVIKIDPADPQEKSFLKQLKISGIPKESTTIFFAPPSAIIASFKGAVTKQALIDAIQRVAAASNSSGRN